MWTDKFEKPLLEIVASQFGGLQKDNLPRRGTCSLTLPGRYGVPQWDFENCNLVNVYIIFHLQHAAGRLHISSEIFLH